LKVVEAHQPVAAQFGYVNHLFDSEPHFLQSHPAVLIRPQYLDARLLQGTKEAPAVVGGAAFARVAPIPLRLARQDLIGALEVRRSSAVTC
jgi:hypothetical protein